MAVSTRASDFTRYYRTVVSATVAPPNFLLPLEVKSNLKAKGNYRFKARALYAFTARLGDPTEISFSKGEILYILNNTGQWWQALKEDASIGIVPSNFLQPLGFKGNLEAEGNFIFKARALCAYTASVDDPTELSFAVGEILDILDDRRAWWQARKEDRTTGIVPSNFLQPLAIEESLKAGGNYRFKAQALYAYTASFDDPTELSFTVGEVLDILDNSRAWWQARKEDGTIGTVPSTFLQPLAAEDILKVEGGYGFKAQALYAFTASLDDPAELSFIVGEVLDILDDSQEWWQARKEDGTTGIVPSSFLQPLDTAWPAPAVGSATYNYHVCKAQALYTCSPDPEDPTGISFVRGEILDILDKKGSWWQARKEDGTTGFVSPNFLQLI